MNNIPMPPRNTISEIVARAGAKCLFLACKNNFLLLLLVRLLLSFQEGHPVREIRIIGKVELYGLRPRILENHEILRLTILNERLLKKDLIVPLPVFFL